jgi:Carboxypeptidase regulatory-like domain/TonB dependent receptor-like, beta-barrel/TonB-dependent Receptor Plug Domain
MRRQLVWAVVFVLASFGIAHAQETTTGSITGIVVDTQGAAVPGATVTVTSDQGVKSFVTDTNGRFFAPYLTLGTYTVRVELAGFSPVEHKGVSVRLGARVELNFTLKVSEIQEVVEVVGAAPTIDTNSTTVGGTLDTDTLKRLPVGRNFTDTLYLVPGVSSSGGVGNANPSVSGASGLENNYIVDGVNITNVGYGGVGSYSIVFGSLGSGVTTDFIKETQVKTAGFEAEYGQSTGGVVNVVTQSGSNAFHGNVFGYFRPNSLEASWDQLNSPNGTVNTTGQDKYDFGASLGGPIMKDKLFFFGSFNPQYETRTFVAPPGFPLASQGPIDRKRHTLAYAGKLTWQVTPNHRFDVSAFGDPAKGALGPQRFTALTADERYFSSIDYGGHNQSVHYDGILNRNWLIEASYAHAKNTISETPAANEWNVVDTTVTPNIVSGGIGFYEQGNEGINNQYQFKSTNIFDAGGNHQLRYGVQFQDISYSNINQRTGPTFTTPDGTQTATGAQINVISDPVYGKIYRVIRANLNSGRMTTQKYLSFFAQDTWQIGNKLTIKPGVRYEQQKLEGSQPPPDVCFEGDTVPGAGNGSGPAIPCSFKWSNNWAPRIGVIYDFKGNGRSKVYASFGRFFTTIPNDLAARAMSADAGVSRADYFDAGLTQPIPNGVLAGDVTNHYLLAGAGASQISPDSKSSYQQEFQGGIEMAVAQNLSLGVRYIHRTTPRILEDYQPAPVVAFDLGCPGADTVEYFIDNISPNLPIFHCNGIADASFENPVHKYDAVEVTANKNFSDNWSLIASYRWSKLQGLYEGAFRNDNGQSDPSITSLFDFPTNDPSYTEVGVPQFGYRGDIRYQGCTLGCGVLPNDRTHQVKLYGARAWGDLNLSVGINAGTGTPLTNLAANPNYGNAGEIPVTQKGGGIDTGADGFRTRAPMDFTVDAHVDYTIKFGDQRVMLLADAFNLFNRQSATWYDYCSDQSFGASNPNFGVAANGCRSRQTSYQVPLALRLGARLEW